jgi:hypothetical protein
MAGSGCLGLPLRPRDLCLAVTSNITAARGSYYTPKDPPKDHEKKHKALPGGMVIDLSVFLFQNIQDVTCGGASY